MIPTNPLAQAASPRPLSGVNIDMAIRKECGDVLSQLRREVSLERTAHTTELQINNRLWKGDYAAVPQIMNGQMGLVSMLSGALGGSGSGGNLGNLPQYRFNFYRGDGSKLTGALSIAPNCRAEVDDSDDQEAVARKRVWDKLVQALYRHWGMEYVMPEIVQALYERGNIFIHTPFVVDRNKYGVHQSPRMIKQQREISPAHYMCALCKAPNPQQLAEETGRCGSCGTQLSREDFRPPEYTDVDIQDPNQPWVNHPAGGVEFSIYDSRTTFTSYQLDKWDQATWLCNEQFVYRGALISSYPWLAQSDALIRKFEAGGADELGDYVTSKTVTSSKNYTSLPKSMSDRKTFWKWTRWYLDPAMLWQIENQKVRDMLLQTFPTGAKIELINGLIANIDHCQLMKEWVGIKPFAGAGFYTKPLGEEHAKSAPIINDMLGITISTAQKGSPITIYDPDLFDMNELRKQPVMVNEMIPSMPVPGRNLRDMIFQTQPTTLNPAVPQTMEMMITNVRDTANMSPHMWGAGPVEQTLGATSLKRDQAMQPHNVTYGCIRWGLSRAYDNGVWQLVTHAQQDGTVYFSPRPGEIETYKHKLIPELLKGGVYTWVSDRIPLTWAQREAKIWQTAELPPQIALAILGLDKPYNVNAIQDAIGFTSLKANLYEAYNKVMRTISRLLKAQPIMGKPQIDPMTQQLIPPQPMPSEPIDEFEDDHMFCAMMVKEWAQTEKADEYRGTPGYMNVILWAKQHMDITNMLAAQQASMQPPPGGPNGPGGPGGPGGPNGPGPAQQPPNGPGSPTTPQIGPPQGPDPLASGVLPSPTPETPPELR